MNERIKQIIDICGLYLPPDNPEVLEKELEFFAEFIVKECMEVASPNYMDTPEDSAYYVELAIDRIADHFGVEE
jgi:hypothetical protein